MDEDEHAILHDSGVNNTDAQKLTPTAILNMEEHDKDDDLVVQLHSWSLIVGANSPCEQPGSTLMLVCLRLQ